MLATIGVALASADWAVNWRDSVCVVWGCGPPLQALVACHPAWLILFIRCAPGIWRFCPSRAQRRIATAMLLLAVISAMGVGNPEALTWLPQATESQRPFSWHRVGFVILTTVELPLLEIAGLASVVGPGSVRRDLCETHRDVSVEYRN